MLEPKGLQQWTMWLADVSTHAVTGGGAVPASR